MQKTYRSDVVKSVKQINSSHETIEKHLGRIFNYLSEDGISMKDSVKTVCSFYDDWPIYDEDTTRSKAGDVVSISTIKNNADYADFKASETFRLVNNFERSWRRYYTAGNEGEIAIKPPASGKADQPTKTDADVLASINEMLAKAVKKLGKIDGTDDIVKALNPSIVAITEKISDLKNEKTMAQVAKDISESAGNNPAENLDKVING